MKKRYLWMALLCVFLFLSGCGEKLDYDQEAAVECTEAYLEKFTLLDEDSIQGLLSVDTSTMEDEYLVLYYGVESYANALEDAGQPTGEYGDVDLSESEDEVVATVEVEAEKRSMTLEIIYSVGKGQLSPESITFNVNYSMGESLLSAAENTLIGMVAVFAILILISLAISQLKNIDKLIDRVMKVSGEDAPGSPSGTAAKKPDSPAAADETAGNGSAAGNPSSGDETELVAVIAAAIAASEGISPDTFVVRSIRRASRWKRTV